MVFGRNKPSPSTASPSSAAAAACAEVRAAYHECFNRWYAEKFAKGQWHKDDCVGQWNKYRACLEVNLDLCPMNLSPSSSRSRARSPRLPLWFDPISRLLEIPSLTDSFLGFHVLLMGISEVILSGDRIACLCRACSLGWNWSREV